MDRETLLKRMQNVARIRGGECLSVEYKSSRVKLHWRCKLGHEWEAIPNSVTPRVGFKGSWCPICAGKYPKDTLLKQCQTLAASHGGVLLSKRYVDSKTWLRWKCEKGHEWSSIPDSIKRGSWCPICSGKSRSTLRRMREHARSLGGKCRSVEYVNAHRPLLWRCVEGHEWEAKFAHILQGHWCPICSSGISERICRALMEHLTGVPFPKTRPKWLKNARGNQMELDGYAPALRLAFEYQGHQHYKRISLFHSSAEEFHKRQQDDKRKLRLCRKHNIMLLLVPHRVPHKNLQVYLVRQLQSIRDGLVVNRNPIEIRQLDVWRRKETEEMKRIAASRDGKLLSKTYINDATKLRWRCAEGHTWETTPNIIKHGGWCGVCGRKRAAEKRAYTIDDMREFAKSKGGTCLSKDYYNNQDRLVWRCALGHEWETQAMVVISGHWCPKCARQAVGRKTALTLKDIRETAAKRGGKCLTRIYLNARQTLTWRCAEGHEWKTNAHCIRRGTWCPVCARKR